MSRPLDMSDKALSPGAVKVRRRGCRVTGKRRFRDHRHAVEALHAASNARTRAEEIGLTTRRQERRTYFCGACGGWHLTSQAARTGEVAAKPAPRRASQINRPRQPDLLQTVSISSGLRERNQP